MQLLRRLSNVSPTYNHLQWKKDRVENEKLIASKCKYPYALNSGEAMPSLQQSQTLYGGGYAGLGDSQKLNASQRTSQDLGGTQNQWAANQVYAQRY